MANANYCQINQYINIINLVCNANYEQMNKQTLLSVFVICQCYILFPDLDAEQPGLQVGHGFLSQSQIPDHHKQSLIREETLVYRRHAGRAANVPHAEGHRINLDPQQTQSHIDNFTQ